MPPCFLSYICILMDTVCDVSEDKFLAVTVQIRWTIFAVCLICWMTQTLTGTFVPKTVMVLSILFYLLRYIPTYSNFVVGGLGGCQQCSINCI